MLEPTVTHEFQIALVDGPRFDQDTKCPYCQSKEKPNYIKSLETHTILADVMQCSPCNQNYIVVEHPTLDAIGRQDLMLHYQIQDVE